MNAVTYDLRTAVGSPVASKPEKGVFARILDALIEARMREAQRQIDMHLRYVPEDVLKAAGLTASYKDAEKLPFVK